MVTFSRLKKALKPRYLFVLMLLAILLFSSCTGGKSVPKGWSGVTIDGSNALGGANLGEIREAVLEQGQPAIGLVDQIEPA